MFNVLDMADGFGSLADFTRMESMLRSTAGIPPRHRSGGQRAHRAWKKRRASGVQP